MSVQTDTDDPETETEIDPDPDPDPDSSHPNADPAVSRRRVIKATEVGSQQDAEPIPSDLDGRYTVLPEVDGGLGMGQGFGPLVDAWVEYQYPLNRDCDLAEGTIEHSARCRGIHSPDGSGRLESKHGTALYGVRAANGVIVGNETRGLLFPWKSKYDIGYDRFIELPFQFVGQVLTEQTSLDIGFEEPSILRAGSPEDALVEGEEFMRGIVEADILDGEGLDADEEGVLLTHTTGAQVYIGFDSTAHDRFGLFGFVPFDGETGVKTPSARDALALLTPNEAAAADEQAVVRQGEWFLVPTRQDAAGSVQKPGVNARPFGGSPLDNHVPRDWRTVVTDEMFVGRFQRAFADRLEDVTALETPQDCLDAVHEARLLRHGERPGDEDVDALVFDEVYELAGGIQVRGTLRHRENEHRMESVAEWRQATTHDWEVITLDADGRTAMMD